MIFSKVEALSFVSGVVLLEKSEKMNFLLSERGNVIHELSKLGFIKANRDVFRVLVSSYLVPKVISTGPFIFQLKRIQTQYQQRLRFVAFLIKSHFSPYSPHSDTV